MVRPASSEDAPRAVTPIIRRSLGADVYTVLWDRILSRSLHPGEKLSDLHLSDELGVSRTPVREALHRLVQDGVVSYHPNRGFYVASFERSDIAEIFDLRAALEALALRRVAASMTPGDFRGAREELDRVGNLIADAEDDEQRHEAASAFLAIDQGFHRWLIEGSENKRLITIVNGLWAQISVFQRAGTHVPGWMEIALEQHATILDELVAGNIDGAADALEQHIVDMKDRLLADFFGEDEPTSTSNESETESIRAE